jgi:hypothetical protein
MLAQDSAALGEGERSQRARARRQIAVKATLFLIGLAAGVYVGYAVVANDFDMSLSFPRHVAVGLAALYVVALSVGSLLLDKSIDELERHRAYKAITVPATAYMIVYPVWFLLWKGQLMVEPVHWILFVGFLVLLLVATAYYRFR